MTGDLVRIDTAARQAWVGERPLRLTALAFDLLVYLTSRAGEVVSQRDIARDVWRTDWASVAKTARMQLTKLRQALGDTRLSPRYISTVRGFGYRFNASCLAPREAQPETPVVRVQYDEDRLAALVGRHIEGHRDHIRDQAAIDFSRWCEEQAAAMRETGKHDPISWAVHERCHTDAEVTRADPKVIAAVAWEAVAAVFSFGDPTREITHDIAESGQEVPDGD